jgi:serine protease AprX
VGVAEVRGISKEVVGLILFGRGDRQRFVQESPILPDVWELFAKRPTERHDLLIAPLGSCSAIAAMRAIRDSLAERGLPFEQLVAAELAPLQSFVGAKLTFEELIAVVLPRTEWVAKARERFARQDSGLPFDPGRAVDQVVRSALGLLPQRPKSKDETPLGGQLFEIARTLTLIAAIYASEDPTIPEIDDPLELEPLKPRIVEGVVALLGALKARPRSEPLIGRITSNRPVMQATLASREAVKADAAFRLFDIRCNDITWAVIDSGIERDHPAFVRRDKETNEIVERRVIRSYELGILRPLLNAAYEDSPGDNPVLKDCIEGAGLDPGKALGYLEKAYQSYATEILDWSSIEPLLRLAEPGVPADGHGTHVAGIIGGDWTNEEGKPVVRGLCPDIKLMDFRIIGQDLDETEFAVLGALQLVRYLNSHNRYIVVHGVNLSLSIPHKVGSFACGRTPVCVEAERLVGAGITVVAAAGNAGFHEFETSGLPYRGYAQVSITDPGNAEGVITVGATHKTEPHAYGISYFSSRGPTADGRIKPDLVAPGERIESCLPNEERGPLDGTSQAAPHVSAAAAMLMARYPELNREPRRIKQILCESATDLGRERVFQGHGLLDVLRALQAF